MLTFAEFTPKTPGLIDGLKKLVSIESPSTEKLAVDRLVSVLHVELENLGAFVSEVVQTSVGNQLIARWNQPVSKKSGLLFLCHMDTVYDLGTLQKRPLKIDGDRLYGPGALDMKAGIVLLLEAVRNLQEMGQFPNRPITALFTSDEETGSIHSRALIEQLASTAELTLCLEAAMPDGSLKTARKGTGELEIITRGVAAHAGVDHSKGRNAIEELAHHILAVQRLTDYATGTTLSVGKVSGGTRTNVVPDDARAVVDLRVTSSAEADRIRAWASQVRPVLEGTSVTVHVHQDRPPMPRDAIMIATFERVRSIAQKLGLNLGEGSTGGGSDANFVAALGKAVMDGLGAIGEGGHSEKEYVLIPSLAERAALLAGIITEWK